MRKVHFKWKSWRTFYTSFFVMSVIISVCANVYKHISRGRLTPTSINGAIFYITSTISCALFLKVNWRCFFIGWSKVENIFLISNYYKHPPQQMTLKKKVYICIVIGLTAYLVNQVLYFTSEIKKASHRVQVCNFTTSVVEEFVVDHLNHIFSVLPYNHAFGAIGEFFHCAMSFYWTFPDIFIMLLSIGISYRFQQINKRIEYFKCRIVSNDIWNEVRLHYVDVCELVKLVDTTFDKMILLATLNNSYMILVQVLHIVT
jgi:gustatory receptor